MNFQKSKYRKVHKPRVSTVLFEQKRLVPVYGMYALKVAVTARITFARLDAARRTIKKIVKKNGYVALVSAGSLLFELGGGGLTEKLARQAFLQASHKLGLPTRIVRYLV
jgi:ribosomal protein L16/L10AE